MFFYLYFLNSVFDVCLIVTIIVVLDMIRFVRFFFNCFLICGIVFVRVWIEICLIGV